MKKALRLLVVPSVCAAGVLAMAAAAPAAQCKLHRDIWNTNAPAPAK
jgi:hypothetical protein